MHGEISYDLVMDDDMPFVEGTFRLPNGEWQVVIVTKYDIHEPQVQRQRWASGIEGVYARFPKYDRLDQDAVEQLLRCEFGIIGWNRVRGPDSMQLR